MSAGYFGTEVLRDISFEIHEPAVYVVLGPNGAGKTTLFRALSGVLARTRGEVTVGGESIDRAGAHGRMHYLSHLDGLPDSLRVRETLDFYARVERAGTADIERVLDELEIRELADRFPAQLSAGQRKRVSIARIFLRERSIYLLDEPTSSLDPKVAREIRGLILRLSRDKIVLYSSHNLFEAREIGRYVLVIRQGKLAVFDRMEDLRAAKFVVGIRTSEPNPALESLPRQGDYYLKELAGPDAVDGFVRELVTEGVKVREVKEMENPLEDLFA